MTDRLPAIIQAMQDAAHEAGDLVLASALALATSPAEVAPLLPLTGADAMQGAGLYALKLDPEVSGTTAASLGAADHALACRVAARLASTACLILAIDAKGHHDAAGALWLAAAHLTSLPAEPGTTATSDDAEDAYVCGSEVRCNRCGSHVAWVDLAMSEHRQECDGGA